MKYYPTELNLSIGDLFERTPRSVHFHRVSGSHPLYGRVIDKVTRVSEHKLEVLLGAYMLDAYDEVSDTALVAVYGELNDYIKE